MTNDSQNLVDSIIMMVDDEPITMDVVQTFLEEFGYSKFIQIEDPLLAMDGLEKQPPDVLLLDLKMPGKDGMEILAEIRANKRFNHLPVVVLTASSDTQDKLRALELGATDFLSKPVDQSELGLRVRNTLAAKAYMDQLAYYDPVTKLPNTHMFNDRLNWALEKAKRYGEKLSLMNIALDHFSRINATIGLDASNELIAEIANRLAEAVRNIDTITATHSEMKGALGLFRVEGSAFTLLLDRPKNAESAAVVAERILNVIKKPVMLSGNKEVVVTASIGIASYPEEGSDTATLRRLMVSAKDYSRTKGGDCFHFSTKEINKIYQKRNDMESQLRYAVERNELLLHFQPKVDIKTEEIDGLEALVRWQSEVFGFVSPGDFIPLAEETKLIVPIGEWVLGEACRTLVEWSKRGIKDIIMSVNLSAVQMNDPHLIDNIKNILTTTGVNTAQIELEITESLLLDNIEEKIDLLLALKALGVRLSIDDFGTGYSSLSYLTRLPVDELKIDRSFILHVEESKDARAMVSSIIFMAHSLGLTTVAEGIETEKQLKIIGGHGCDRYQGYLCSHPLPANEIINILPRSISAE